MVKEIKIAALVPKCTNNDDGIVVFKEIKTALDAGETVMVSFAGIYSVPSSFINTAFVQLLSYYPMSEIKQRVSFKDSTKHINDSVKRRFAVESERVHA